MEYQLIDPVLIRIGPFSVRWYGLMYILGFLSSYLLVLYQIKKKGAKIKKAVIDDLYFYIIIGLIIGARLGYVVFYNPVFYLKNPLDIFAIWHGGMSFHGGLIGAFIAGYIIIKKRRLDLLETADLIIPTCPIGLGLGRLGNFINGELFGRPSQLPWAMTFPGGGAITRHPSQLYEAFFEGLLLFLILWISKDKKKLKGDLLALFLILYGLFRFFCEFFREPDLQIGYIFGFLTMGQILSLVMLVCGLFLRFIYLPKITNPQRDQAAK